MSHFLILPTNENGLILDENFRREVITLANQPFAFDNFFVYSHGWWTSANRAMGDYNRFSVEFARTIGVLLGAPPVPALGAGIHWPSMLSEDAGNIANYAEALSFYTMEKRADAIGEHGGFTLVRTLLDELMHRAGDFSLNLIGHSFGCKVICSTLAELASDGGAIPAKAKINVVLLQAAQDNNSLDQGECYGKVIDHFPQIRFLISTSAEDKALNSAYPKAHKLANLFHHTYPALGAAGPSAALSTRFAGSSSHLAVDSGFTQSGKSALKQRLVVADLSPLHQHDSYPPDGFGGHHSDIFQPEIYELLYGFLFP